MKILPRIRPVMALLPLTLLVACAGQQTDSASSDSQAAQSSQAIENGQSVAQSDQSKAFSNPSRENIDHAKAEIQNKETPTQEPDVLAMAKAVETTATAEETTSSATGIDEALTASEEPTMTTLVIENPGLFNLPANHPALTATFSTTSDQPEYFKTADSTTPKNTKYFFGFGKNTLTPEDMKQIRKQGAFLAKNPQLSVSIHGHTDSLGQDAYNRQLSSERAEAVAKIFAEEGVKASQIEVFGWGSQRPLVSNTLYQENRRVELQFDEVKYAAN